MDATRYFAFGLPGKSIRTVLRYQDEAHLRLNRSVGEFFVEVESRNIRGSISSDGKSIIMAGTNMADELAKIRQRRTELLARCDYTILPDSPFTPSEREDWAAYRSALRDITTDQPNKTFDQISWPSPPSDK